MTPMNTLWYTRCPAPTAATIAIWEGVLEREFEPDGIAIRSLASAPTQTQRESHYHSTQPNAFRFGGYVPPLVSLSRGAGIRIVGLGMVDRLAAVYVLPDSPIQTGADLRGRRLSVPRRMKDSVDWWRATVMAGYETALPQVGLGWADVVPTDIAIPRAYFEDAHVSGGGNASLWGARSQFAVQREEIAALLRGEVDAVYSDSALAALLVSFLGLRPVITLDGRADAFAAYPYLLPLTVSCGLLDSRPDLVTRWLAALLRAGAWAADHPERTVQLVARDSGLPEDLVSLGYSDRVPGMLDVSLDAARVAAFSARLDLLGRHGFLAAPVDLETAIDPAPLDAARRSLAGGGVHKLPTS